MSHNNLILVAHLEGRSYVFANAYADTQWAPEWSKAQIATGERPYKRKRSQALVLAHNLQNRLNTEYGVREIFLKTLPRERA